MSASPRVDSGARAARRAWLLRVLGTLAALALWWQLARISPSELLEALGRLEPQALLAGLLFGLLGVGCVALRWKLLLRAYGARRAYRWPRLARLHLVGMFYNTFLPANVGGDILRAHLTRDAFEGVTGAYLIVGIERVFGLAGLALLAGVALLWAPLEGIRGLPLLAAFALLGASGAAASPMLMRALGSRLPGRIGAWARRLPRVRLPSLFLPVLALSVASQVASALIGFTIIDSISPIQLLQALLLVPVALVSSYLPTVAGLGARETAFVVLLAYAGISQADATAASLGYLAVQLALALLGGLIHLLGVAAPPEAGRIDDEPGDGPGDGGVDSATIGPQG